MNYQTHKSRAEASLVDRLARHGRDLYPVPVAPSGPNVQPHP